MKLLRYGVFSWTDFRDALVPWIKNAAPNYKGVQEGIVAATCKDEFSMKFPLVIFSSQTAMRFALRFGLKKITRGNFIENSSLTIVSNLQIWNHFLKTIFWLHLD